MKRVAGWAGLALVVCVPAGAQEEPRVDFVREVQPILRQHCASCHAGKKKKGGFRVDMRSAAMRGGVSGKAIVPGKPGESPLYTLLVERDEDHRMPQEAPALPAAQVEILRRWIDQGAAWPDAAAGEEAARPHWAYVPPSAASPPGPGHPVDAFLDAAQRRLGLKARPPAAPALLLRRLSLDLIGLPPTREELRAFLDDPSPEAYERAVDRLLADPRHGERWGRHFLDVWRYSDWAGFKDEIRDSQPHIWRWRDWVVESLNADTPYDRMVLEMLAGDELAPDDPSTLRATGFLVRNWKRYSRNAWLEATVEHTAKAFLATTMNCAKCHDHFFDPITQDEYFAFRAFFEPHGVRTDRLEGGSYDTTQVGLVRAFDEKLDAPTYKFERGDDRSPDTSRSIPPAVPLALGGAPLRIEPVTLPAWAAAPDRRSFVRDLARADADKAVLEAARKLAEPSPGAALDLAVADAKREALVAVLEVERLEDAGPKDEAWKRAAEAAVRAQRREALLDAARVRVVERQAKKPDPKKIEAADKVFEKAEKAYGEPPNTTYAPRKTPAYPATSTGRRLALARWIASPENPLAARAAVNHVWLRHFGAALVPTVFDFGHNGAKPVHPELLDWLATEFVRQGWSLKKLHRLLVTSAAYRRDSGADAELLAKDPANAAYARMNVRRMEAEAVRDGVLYVAGTLDPARGGPELDHQSALTTRRRSLYYRHAAEKQALFLMLFDAPSVDECYERSDSIIPQQALALANSTLVEESARAFAKRLPPVGFVPAAFEAILGRPPSKAEVEACEAFLSTAGPRGPERLAHALFNHNDFVTIR